MTILKCKVALLSLLNVLIRSRLLPGSMVRKRRPKSCFFNIVTRGKYLAKIKRVKMR